MSAWKRLAQFAMVVEKWLASEPSPRLIRWRNLIVCSVTAIVCGYAISQTSLLKFRETKLGPHDLSLAGTWKYRIADSDAFSNPTLDDSNWCLISVPDGGQTPIASSADHPAADCPKEIYPAAQLRNHTYWYRKSFVIPPGMTWKDPALFIGVAKDREWVYLDGQFVGSGFRELVPQVFILPKDLALPGLHTISVRSQTTQSLRPGLFHAYSDLVSIGELDHFKNSILFNEGTNQELAVVAAVQFVTLLVLLLFVLRTGGANENFFWLALYFGAASLYGTSGIAPIEIQKFILHFVLILMSISIVGYGHQIFFRTNTYLRPMNRAVVTLGFLSIIVKILAPNLPIEIAALELSSIYALGLLAFAAFSIVNQFSILNRRPNARPQIAATDALTGAALITLHLCHLYEGVLKAGHAVFIHLPLLTAILTMAVIVISAEDYIGKTKMLAFFGRFIRPGLKQLLWDFRKQPEEEHPWLRGRQISLMKIDIVGFTETTYSMPYGVKRLYQDLWYAHIDRFLEKLSFFNVPEGDGSIYCINEDLPGGSCAELIKTAETLALKGILEFDLDFMTRLTKLLETVPELKYPLDLFTARFKSSHGRDFWSNKTQARFVLNYGWVDEGLWGLKSQSHYNVSGNLLIEMARLEKHASAGEFLITRSFFDQWKKEDPIAISFFSIEWRSAPLKGIGAYDYAIVKRKSERKTAA